MKWINSIILFSVFLIKIQALPTNHAVANIPDKIRFYLYTQSNPDVPTEIVMNDLESLHKSPFDSKNPTRIAIHGWKDEYSVGAAQVIKSSLLKKDLNRTLNVIAVDWKVYSYYENYTISKEYCSTAGKTVAQFVDWMYDNAGLKFDTLTLYGVSMGAHVSGFTGKNVKRGKIHSIIALDPALPEFDYSKPQERLADTDAEYVESIQTNGGYWGFYLPIGQISFYPNGGKHQPGCDDEMCSHNRAVGYLIEVINAPQKNDFHAIKCDGFMQMEERKCDQFDSIIQLADPKNIHKPKGIYYLETNSASPYAKGIEDIIKRIQEIKKTIQS